MATVGIKPATGGPPIGQTREEFSKEWGVPQQYLVSLRVTGDNSLFAAATDFVSSSGNANTQAKAFEISTSIDETFSLSMGSQWDAPFADVLQDSKGGQTSRGALVKAGLEAMGVATRARGMSAQVWRSSDPMGFTIPFTFIAKDDPVKDVKEKVRNLLKLCAPSETGKGFLALLTAPGPTMGGNMAQSVGLSGRKITLQIGTFLTLYNCIITRVDVQFDSLMGEAGIPLKAKVNVDIQSYFTCFTTRDIDSLFDNVERDQQG